jgi:hypothetical protein
MQIRIAHLSDVTTLYDIRQAAIPRLSLTHFSDRDAWRRLSRTMRWRLLRSTGRPWAGFGEQPTSSRLFTSLHRQPIKASAQHSSDSPKAAWRERATISSCEASLNTVDFYLRLGYVPAGAELSSTAVPMHKQLGPAYNAANPALNRTGRYAAFHWWPLAQPAGWLDTWGVLACVLETLPAIFAGID